MDNEKQMAKEIMRVLPMESNGRLLSSSSSVELIGPEMRLPILLNVP